jgi:hypothetical protein
MKRNVGLKRKTPLRRISKKRQGDLKKYSEMRRNFLHGLPLCEVCAKAKSTDVHHKKGRGKYYLDEDTWLATCRRCHDQIHANPAWAREKGYLLDRYVDE